MGIPGLHGKTAQRNRAILEVALLTLAGVWATLNSPTIFLDHQILLGCSLGVFALLRFGWLGLPVGIACAIATIRLWGHPWAAVILVLQLLWQQLFLSRFNGGPEERGNGRIVLATMGFWLLVGLPLRTLLYGGLLQAGLNSALALGLKEAVTSVVNAALALLAYLLLQLGQRRGPGRELSLRGLVFTVLLLMISLPGVLIITVMGQQVTDQALSKTSLRLEQQAETVTYLLQARSKELPDQGLHHERNAGLAYGAEGVDGSRLVSDPVVFRSLERDYRPLREAIHLPEGLTLLIPQQPSSMLQRKLRGYWRYQLTLPDGPGEAWRQITVVQPARRDIEQMLRGLRPSLQILAVLLIAAALISELVTTLLASQFNRIVASLTPANASGDPGGLPGAQLAMPELHPTRLRELNRIVELINRQGRTVNQLSSELLQSNAQLRLRASTDDLTGLLNRRALMEQLQELLEQPDRRHNDGRLALLFLDLDLFKEINDSLGHSAGDRVLQTVSRRVRQCLRTDDLVARMGGDEMVVVLTTTPSLEAALAVAEKIGQAIAAPISSGDLQAGITASIGVAMARADESVDALMARADHAMYEAKRAGRNQVITIP